MPVGRWVFVHGRLLVPRPRGGASAHHGKYRIHARVPFSPIPASTRPFTGGAPPPSRGPPLGLAPLGIASRPPRPPPPVEGVGYPRGGRTGPPCGAPTWRPTPTRPPPRHTLTIIPDAKGESPRPARVTHCIPTQTPPQCPLGPPGQLPLGGHRSPLPGRPLFRGGALGPCGRHSPVLGNRPPEP